MARLLYLVHRMPFPPDKGDKVRSYHLLRHLARRHEVHLGTFVDDPADMAHVGTVAQWCAGVKAVALNPRLARLTSLAGLFTGEALTLRYYRSTALHHWVRQAAREQAFDASVVFSSSMAPFALDNPGTGRLLMDFVDMDSAKWAEYGRRHHGPLAWLYAREGRTLLAHERASAAQAYRSCFVTAQECELFLDHAPEHRGYVEAVGNGVNAEHFQVDPSRSSPFDPDERAVVFTGAMDYWPNVDAVQWAAQAILPALKQALAGHRIRLWIVGRNPSPAVQALAGTDVCVTGTVPDVRPYLQHAAAVVAPLRLARGVQNKVLEAMAMGCAVVAARPCTQALSAEVPDELMAADDAHDYVRALTSLLLEPFRAKAIGVAARQRVLRDYSWDAHLAAFDRALEGVGESVHRSSATSLHDEVPA